MSLRLGIAAIEQKDSFIVTNCTGKYSGNNQGGFGIPNIQIDNIETSTIEIKTPKGDVFSLIIPVGDFPNEEGIGYEILPYMIGMQEIESGEYNLKLVITGTDKKGKKFNKFAVFKVIFTKSVTCCVDKMLSKNIGTENLEKKKEMVELNNLINSMHESIRCEKYSISTKIIDLLKERCSCCNCKN